MVALLAVLLIGVAALVGAYVWRDAKKRGLNAELWMLVALLAPALVGFIIYMIVRGSGGELCCPRCSSPVEERYAVCPKCGAQLKAACPACSAPVESAWRVCPYCAARLEPEEGVMPPVRRKDRALGIILAAVILVPLVIIGATSLLAVSEVRHGAMNTIYYESTEHYLESVAKESYADELRQWLDGCDREMHGAYALRYRVQKDGEKVTQYLIRLPAGDEKTAIDIKSHFGLRSYVDVSFTDDGSGAYSGYSLCTVSVRGNTWVGLETYLNLEKLPCQITDFDNRLVPFELMEGGGSVKFQERLQEKLEKRN